MGLYYKNTEYNPKYDFIEGPVTLTELYSHKYKKHIYIFGDLHVKNSTCPNSNNFIMFLRNQITSNLNKTIDFYIEAPFVKRDVQDSYIKDVDDLFRYYITVYKNLRLHFSDIRAYEIASAYQIAHETEDIKEILSLFPYSKDIPYIFQKLKIYKQFENSDLLPNDKNIIFKILQLEMDKNMLKPTDAMYAHNIMIKFLNLYAWIMDAYLIGRLFKANYKPKISNIMIYVGDRHANNYINILTRIGFKIINRVESNTKDDFQCIDVRSFKQPFFYF
jgi:hypothetical protein